MKNWVKILIVLVILGLVGAYVVYKYVYNKPHPDYEKAEAALTVTAPLIYNDFKTNKAGADGKYTGKVIDITGTLTRMEEADSLMVAVFVLGQGDFGEEGVRITMLPQFSETARQWMEGKELKLKGYCTGFNDSDVILENGSPAE